MCKYVYAKIEGCSNITHERGAHKVWNAFLGKIAFLARYKKVKGRKDDKTVPWTVFVCEG